MSIVLDLTPTEEASLSTLAIRGGIAPEEMAAKLVRQALEQQRDEAKIAPIDPTLALIEEWLSEAPTEPEEIREAEEDFRESQKALNATRKEAGARILFPAVEES